MGLPICVITLECVNEIIIIHTHLSHHRKTRDQKKEDEKEEVDSMLTFRSHSLTHKAVGEITTDHLKFLSIPLMGLGVIHIKHHVDEQQLKQSITFHS